VVVGPDFENIKINWQKMASFLKFEAPDRHGLKGAGNSGIVVRFDQH